MENKLTIEGSSVVVTGGCGFIGSHLVTKLASKGAKKITVIDSLKYGNRSNLAKGNIDIIQHEIGSSKDESVFKAIEGADLLFHLAAEKHNQAIDNPEAIIKCNINGTFRLFEAAAKYKVKRTVFSSSLYAYGRMNEPPMTETDKPEPRTIYGISKLTGELLLGYFGKGVGLSHNILRYFFVYGPKQFSGTGYKSVIVKNFERIMKNEEPVINGDGEQVLDYIYIDDVVTATISAAESPVSGEIFNIGSSLPTSINSLVSSMLKVSGKQLKPKTGPADFTSGTYRVANISKAKKLLDFRPKIPLEEGLMRTYGWLMGNTR